ncbi:hypothetical protein Tsubulata_033582 [Turnera subulata]|uniref:Peroxidase n=1 Tax=Turnera subulata TaxID=218843 RepID=A0A9Q0G319_9ROSI|nr:hypothetical protein Tsubulata_033582 [Turnera subulata]
MQYCFSYFSSFFPFLLLFPHGFSSFHGHCSRTPPAQPPLPSPGTLRVPPPLPLTPPSFLHRAPLCSHRNDLEKLLSSTPFNSAERDADINLSLPGDAFDLLTRSKTALVLSFPGTVSCADILAAATSDLITIVGGPYYGVLLGRKDYHTYMVGFVLANIVGLKYYSGRITGRELVGLVREPLNPYDGNAIKVLNTLSVQVFKLADERARKEGQMGHLEPQTEVIKSPLFPHQKEALWWLVNRENSTELPPFWEERDGEYVNVLTNFHTDKHPEPLRGGILADDMAWKDSNLALFDCS